MKNKKLVLLIIVIVITVLAAVYIKRVLEDSEKANTPLDCADQWVDDVRTLEETMDCINYNMEKNKSIQSGSGYST